MGRPKQLLPIDGRPLLVRTVSTALAAGCRPVVVVLGRDGDACATALISWLRHQGTAPFHRSITAAASHRYRPEFAHRGGRVIFANNPAWVTGMGSSLRVGVRKLGPAAAAYVLLCDQPGVTAQTLRRLDAARRREGRPVCVAAYADAVGPPLRVGGKYLQRLADWSEDGGAKSLWTANPDDVTRVACPEAADDLDTPDAYDRWVTLHSGTGTKDRVAADGVRDRPA